MIDGPKVALFGLYGSGNLGNGGSLDAMLRFLRTAHPEAEVTCVCPGPEDVEREFGIPAFAMTWYRPVEGDAAAKTLLRKAAGKVVDVVRTLRWIRRFDVVVVPGTGVLEATLPIRPWGVPYALLLVSAWGRWCGTKVALVSVGADAINQPVTRQVMKHAARLAHYRSYRDERSREVLRAMGVDTSRDGVYPDLAFALPAPPTDDRRQLTIGVGVMAYRGTYLDRRQADRIHTEYVEKLTEFVRWLLDQGYRVRLFTGDPSDEVVATAVMTSIGRSGLDAEFAPSLSGLLDRMSTVDAVVASRFHNVVSALMLAKPTISISYAGKNDALMQSMGQGGFCQPIRSLDVARLIEQFRGLEESREELRTELLDRNEQNRELLAQQYAVLSATLFAAS